MQMDMLLAKLADDTITSAKIATNAVASDALNIARSDLPSGTVLQCVTTNYPDDFAFSLNASGNAADNGKIGIVFQGWIRPSRLPQQVAKYFIRLQFI